jgi:hypothetical protein
MFLTAHTWFEANRENDGSWDEYYFLVYFPILKSRVDLWDHLARKRLCKNPLIIASQRLGKNALVIARQRLGKKSPYRC